MPGPSVHRIDPILWSVAGVHLWWYGLSYTLGFLDMHLWFRRARARLNFTPGEVYSFSVLFAAGVLFCGRAVEVVFYEWPYYSRHPGHIPFYWLGGMCTHGLLLGAVVGTGLFARLSRRSFLALMDEIVIPGAFLMGVGRIGNFIDGQIVGRVTDAWWAVKFPDAEGFRHPVVLYDGFKNLLLIPLLLALRRRGPPVPGRLLAHFVFWYGFLRLFVDLFREYPTTLFGLATGQGFNLVMAAAGLVMLWAFPRLRPRAGAPPPARRDAVPLRGLQVAFGFLLLFSLTLPSDWTQDVPARYGSRHAGLKHSALYPPVDAAPE